MMRKGVQRRFLIIAVQQEGDVGLGKRGEWVFKERWKREDWGRKTGMTEDYGDQDAGCRAICRTPA